MGRISPRPRLEQVKRITSKKRWMNHEIQAWSSQIACFVCRGGEADSATDDLCNEPFAEDQGGRPKAGEAERADLLPTRNDDGIRSDAAQRGVGATEPLSH